MSPFIGLFNPVQLGSRMPSWEMKMEESDQWTQRHACWWESDGARWSDEALASLVREPKVTSRQCWVKHLQRREQKSWISHLFYSLTQRSRMLYNIEGVISSVYSSGKRSLFLCKITWTEVLVDLLQPDQCGPFNHTWLELIERSSQYVLQLVSYKNVGRRTSPQFLGESDFSKQEKHLSIQRYGERA